HQGFQCHAALGTVSGLRLLDFRVHRAGVDGAGRHWLSGPCLLGHKIRLRVRLEFFHAAVAAEMVVHVPVVNSFFRHRCHLHATYWVGVGFVSTMGVAMRRMVSAMVRMTVMVRWMRGASIHGNLCIYYEGRMRMTRRLA